MKIYLFISKQKQSLDIYKPYIDALNAHLDITIKLEDADITFILGAWTVQGARLASRSRKMGIPYIVCPLGDISDRNCHNPYLRRSMQTKLYQRNMMRHAQLVIATTPMERLYLVKTGWSQNIKLLRYHAYSQLTTQPVMMENLDEMQGTTLSNYEKQKAEAIAAQTKDIISQQILQIKSRMPHHNIPQQYLNDLHTLLYADNYDEDALNEELYRLKLTSYAAAVFQAMTEKTGLTEGFMPLPAKKSRISKDILRYVK